MNFFKKYEHVKSIPIVTGIKNNYSYSFLIPEYNNPVCLKRALISVYNQRKCPDFEVIICDNSESNINFDVISQFNKYNNLFYYKNEANIGMFGNWNRVYELARTEYCIFLNHDDELLPNYLERINEIIKSQEYDCLKVGNTILRNNKPVNKNSLINRIYLNRKNYIQNPNFYYFLYRDGFPPSGTCIKRDVVIKLGGYNEYYYPASDYEFDARLLKKYKVGLLWERLCNIYIDDSTSMKPDVMIKSANIEYKLNLHVYNDIFKMKGKYNIIAKLKHSYSIKNCNGTEIIHVNLLIKILYRVFVNFMRIFEIFETI